MQRKTEFIASESLSEVHASVDVSSKRSLWKRLMAFLGPAYLVSVGYMDPGNWATDIAGGSQFGYKLIWVLLLSNLMALLLQNLSARLGIVQGMDLAQASRQTYPKFINIPLYVLAEIAIAACDLAEVIGMAIGLKLLLGLPLIWGVFITVLDTLVILLLMNRGIRAMEGFIVSMVFIIGMAFVVDLFITKPDIHEVLLGFEPSELTGDALYIAIGIIGATVMPHNLYLHSSLVQTRKVEKTIKGMKEAIKFNFIDTTIALNLAFFVNAAILVLAASAFHKNGYMDVADIEDAYQLLSNIFGSLAPALFAIALIAAGQSSTVTGTLAGQIIMEGYLNLRIRPWIRRLITRLLAIIPAVFTIIYFGDSGLGDLLVLSQVILSLQLGFAVIPLIHFCSDKQRMHEFTIGKLMKGLSWATALIIVVLNMQLVVEEISIWLQGETVWHIYAMIMPLVFVVGLLLVYITVAPFVVADKKGTGQLVPHVYGVDLKELNGVKYSNIALALDFSDGDVAAIQNAVSQGGKDAVYTLIHIVESAPARLFGNKSDDYESRSDYENLQRYQKELQDKGYTVFIEIGYGDVAFAIAGILKKADFDLLVMASGKKNEVKKTVLGSKADDVRSKVNIPVLIVTKSNN